MQDGFPLPQTAHDLFEWIARCCRDRGERQAIRFDEAMVACGIAGEQELVAALTRLRDCPGLGPHVITEIHNEGGMRCFHVSPEAPRMWEAYRRHIDETVCPNCRIQSLRTVSRIKCTECDYERPVERAE